MPDEMIEPTTDETLLRDWIGNSESVIDTLNASHANKLAGTLDDETVYATGDQLPPAWHWAYFLPGSMQSKLGRDGHPARGHFMPPVALPRRMWAGSELIFEKPVFFGETVTKMSIIEDVKMKSGSSGVLCFVTVRHDYVGESGDHRFADRQTIVYRDDPSPDMPAPKLVESPSGEVIATVEPASTLLFRYSALTFNTHRIHYDREYCLNVEGYPGLVVHGPLQATLLAGQAARRVDGRKIERLTFRARAPLFDTASFIICSGNDNQLWTQSPQGGVAMSLAIKYAA